MTIEFFEIDSNGDPVALNYVPTMGYFRAKLKAEFGNRLVEWVGTTYNLISSLVYSEPGSPGSSASDRKQRVPDVEVFVDPSHVLITDGITAGPQAIAATEERANEAMDCLFAQYTYAADANPILLQPLLMTDYRLMRTATTRYSALIQTGGIFFDRFKYANVNRKTIKDSPQRHAAAMLLRDTDPILWVDEEQYDHPALDATAPNAPNTGEVVQIDRKLKPGWTRVHYVDAGTNTLQWFYVLYDLHPRSGGGSAAMRVDPLAEVEWAWSGSEYGPGIALGLNLTRQVIVAPVDFHTTNTPRSELFAPDDVHSGNPSTPNANDVGGIQYYKQFKTDLPAKRNKPQNPTAPRLPSTKTKAQLKPNVLFRKKRKKQSLTHGQGAGREDAGGVMIRALFDFVHESLRRGSKLSATKYVEAMHTGNEEFKSIDVEFSKAWNAHTPKRNPAETSQEWCHLHGHADGGSEIYDNFVAGSKHCNTEQMAIELGLRTGKYPDLTGRVTAYLFPSQGHGPANITREQIEAEIRKFVKITYNPPASAQSRKRKPSDPLDRKLPDDITTALNKIFANTPQKTAKTENDSADMPIDKAPETGSSPASASENSEDIKDAFETYFQTLVSLNSEQSKTRSLIFQALHALRKPLPIAQWMRYKIYYGDKIIFDHIFDAQSESFDANEFAILRDAVERAVACAVRGDAIKAYNDRMTARLEKIRRAAAESAPMDIEPPPQ